MTKFFYLATAATLALAANPANAQLLGGGGGIGGGLGGLGGVTGSASGAIGSMGGNVSETTRATQAPRIPRQTRQPIPAPAVTTIANGQLAAPNTAANLRSAATVNSATRNVAAGGSLSIAHQPVPTLRAPPLVVPPAVSLNSVHLGYQGGNEVRLLGRHQVLINDGIAVIPSAEVYSYVDREVVTLQGQLAGTGVEVTRHGKQIFIEMPSDVTFAFNKSDIQPRFYHVLYAVSRTLNQFPSTFVDVIGHTDAIGSVGYNQALSERRAGSVANFLEYNHAQPDRLYVEGRGKLEPIASNASIAGRAANRRVEIILTPNEGKS